MRQRKRTTKKKGRWLRAIGVYIGMFLVGIVLLHHESKGLSNTSFDFCQIGVTQLTGLIPHKRGIKGGEFCSHPGGA